MSNTLKHYNDAASRANKISIYCYSSDEEVFFYSFVTNFTDQVSPSWNSQVVYSRMDPLYTYKSTTRKINISFDVPSGDIEDAQDNYENINILLDSMYPSFEDDRLIGSAIVKGPPLFTIEFANYIAGEGDTPLLGIIQNLSFKPEFESGFFINEDGDVFPKLFKLNFTFDVLHIVSEDGLTDIGRYITANEKRVEAKERQMNARRAEIEKLPERLRAEALRKLEEEERANFVGPPTPEQIEEQIEEQMDDQDYEEFLALSTDDTAKPAPQTRHKRNNNKSRNKNSRRRGR